MTCRVKELEQEVVVFNPKKEVIALVAITWAFQIITLCALTYLCFSHSCHTLRTSWAKRVLDAASSMV